MSSTQYRNPQADHPDFDLPWCKRLLSDPNVRFIQQAFSDNQTATSLFDKLLYKPGALQAHIAFQRPTKESDASERVEECMLLSVGNDLDGKAGRAHGGFKSLLLDQLCGLCALHATMNPIPPATATLTVDYKTPIPTPCVVLARAWIIETSGRKIWTRAALQDGAGKTFASAKALFISARTGSL